MLVLADGITFVAGQDSARATVARRHAHVGDRSAVLAGTHRSAASARLEVNKGIEAFRLGAENTPNWARSHASRAEKGFRRARDRLLLVLGNSAMTLGIVGGGALAWLGARRSGGSRLAALSIWVPLPVGRAGRDGRWRRVLRHTAALLTMPIPIGRAVIAARRERRRWIPVGKAARTASPPPLAITAVVVGRRRSGRGTARVGAGVPDPTIAARGLTIRRDIPRGTAVGILVPEPHIGALVSGGRAGRGLGSANLDAAILILPVPVSKVAAESGSRRSSSADQDGHSRDNSRKTHN